MLRHTKAVGIAALFVASVAAKATGWQLHPAISDRGPMLTFGEGESVSYRFECSPTSVIVTQTGVTELVDLRSGKSVGDDAGAIMPEGAAMMALFGGKGDPQFIPATVVKNPAGGWDLTIRLPKDDKQLTVVGASKVLSLFTTGHTMAVAMDKNSRAKWNDFIRSCQAAT